MPRSTPRSISTPWPVPLEFQWGVTNNPYGNQTPPVAVGTGNTALAFSNQLSSLTPGVVYHCRVVATNGDGSTSGNDVLFGSAPVLTLFGAASVTNECHTFFSSPIPAPPMPPVWPVTVTGNLNTNSQFRRLPGHLHGHQLAGSGRHRHPQRGGGGHHPARHHRARSQSPDQRGQHALRGSGRHRVGRLRRQLYRDRHQQRQPCRPRQLHRHLFVHGWLQ